MISYYPTKARWCGKERVRVREIQTKEEKGGGKNEKRKRHKLNGKQIFILTFFYCASLRLYFLSTILPTISISMHHWHIIATCRYGWLHEMVCVFIHSFIHTYVVHLFLMYPVNCWYFSFVCVCMRFCKHLLSLGVNEIGSEFIFYFISSRFCLDDACSQEQENSTFFEVWRKRTEDHINSMACFIGCMDSHVEHDSIIFSAPWIPPKISVTAAK